MENLAYNILLLTEGIVIFIFAIKVEPNDNKIPRIVFEYIPFFYGIFNIYYSFKLMGIV